MSARHTTHGRLWAVTSYFNPGGFRSRRDNYERFRRSLGVPLLTIELGGWHGFDLSPQQSDKLVQLERGDLLWQKERLLTVALDHLPRTCEVVAWIDCDVVFADPLEAHALENAMSRHALVQLFDRLVHLRQGERPEDAAPPAPESVRRSFAAARRAGALPAEFFRRPEISANCRCTCGMAWAARRELLARAGLYDTMVLGMGDKQIAAAAVGRAEDAVVCMEMSDAHADHYRRWAEGFGAGTGGEVGHLPGTAYHLWHGDLSDRRYVGRYQGFRAFAFDPVVDLVRDRDGAWLWASDKRDLHRHVAEYFNSRREDGPGAATAPAPAPVAATGTP